MKLKFSRPLFAWSIIVGLIIGSYFGFKALDQYYNESKILKKIIERLEGESRVAEVLVTGVNFDEKTQKKFTTIKFLEYDIVGKPLEPKYYTFSGNIIQFQSLVIRFDDIQIRQKDKLRGKSVYLFWKVFLLDGKNTQEYAITKINSIPDGYKLENSHSLFEQKLWENFWLYVLNRADARQEGIKNAQIEAPGTMFVPGHLYTIFIEHDGGLRIDSARIPSILRGEKIP